MVDPKYTRALTQTDALLFAGLAVLLNESDADAVKFNKLTSPYEDALTRVPATESVEAFEDMLLEAAEKILDGTFDQAIKDTRRLDHLILTGGVITRTKIGCYLNFGVSEQASVYPSVREAIDASITSDHEVGMQEIKLSSEVMGIRRGTSTGRLSSAIGHFIGDPRK